MKKLLITLGTIGTTVATGATVVACGSSKKDGSENGGSHIIHVGAPSLSPAKDDAFDMFSHLASTFGYKVTASDKLAGIFDASIPVSSSLAFVRSGQITTDEDHNENDWIFLVKGKPKDLKNITLTTDVAKPNATDGTTDYWNVNVKNTFDKLDGSGQSTVSSSLLERWGLTLDSLKLNEPTSTQPTNYVENVSAIITLQNDGTNTRIQISNVAVFAAGQFGITDVATTATATYTEPPKATPTPAP